MSNDLRTVYREFSIQVGFECKWVMCLTWWFSSVIVRSSLDIAQAKEIQLSCVLLVMNHRCC